MKVEERFKKYLEQSCYEIARENESYIEIILSKQSANKDAEAVQFWENVLNQVSIVVSDVIIRGHKLNCGITEPRAIVKNGIHYLVGETVLLLDDELNKNLNFYEKLGCLIDHSPKAQAILKSVDENKNSAGLALYIPILSITGASIIFL